MANWVSSNIGIEDIEHARVADVPVVAGVAVGDVVKPDGVKVAAVADEVGGIVVRVGSNDGNGFGKMTQVIREGFVISIDGTTLGVAANLAIYSKGDGTADSTKPGADGNQITRLAVTYSTTRAYVNVYAYERGA